MKTLSPTQQKVVNLLKANPGSYVHKSTYYNHHSVVSQEPFMHEYGFMTRELCQFSRPTLDVLVRKNIIIADIEKNHILTLNPELP